MDKTADKRERVRESKRDKESKRTGARDRQILTHTPKKKHTPKKCKQQSLIDTHKRVCIDTHKKQKRGSEQY